MENENEGENQPSKKEKKKRVKCSVGEIISTGKGSMSFRFEKPELIQMVEKKIIKPDDYSDNVYRGVCEAIGITAQARNLKRAFSELGLEPEAVLEFLKKNPKAVEGLKHIKK